MSKVTVSVQVDEAERDAWKESAKKAGVSLSEFVRLAVDPQVQPVFVPFVDPFAAREVRRSEAVVIVDAFAEYMGETSARPSKPKSKGRSGTCVHRIEPGNFCKFGCDE